MAIMAIDFDQLDLQGKDMTRALRRRTFTLRRRNHGSKRYDSVHEEEREPSNPHICVTLHGTSMVLPEAKPVRYVDEPFSEPAEYERLEMEELFEDAPRAEFSTEIPFGFHIESHDGSPLQTRQLMISRLVQRADLDLDSAESYAI